MNYYLVSLSSNFHNYPEYRCLFATKISSDKIDEVFSDLYHNGIINCYIYEYSWYKDIIKNCDIFWNLDLNKKYIYEEDFKRDILIEELSRI